MIFLPLAVVACVGGALLGYSWASLIGTSGLRSVAQRLHQEKAFDRVETRLSEATARDIAVSRLIPGLRIYTTLVAGAVGVKRSRFLAGIIPITTVWVLSFVVLGAVVGVPVERLFNQVARLALQGGILVALGAGSLFRHPKDSYVGWCGHHCAPTLSPCCRGRGHRHYDRGQRGYWAAIHRPKLVGAGFIDGWLDGVIALIVVGIFYIYATRRGAGGTVGESLLQTTYASGHPLPLRPRAAYQAAKSLFAGSEDELHVTADQLKALGDANRLRIVGHLLDEPRSADELSSMTSMPAPEVQHELARLQAANVISPMEEAPHSRYMVAAHLSGPLGELLSGR